MRVKFSWDCFFTACCVKYSGGPGSISYHPAIDTCRHVAHASTVASGHFSLAKDRNVFAAMLPQAFSVSSAATASSSDRSSVSRMASTSFSYWLLLAPRSLSTWMAASVWATLPWCRARNSALAAFRSADGATATKSDSNTSWTLGSSDASAELSVWRSSIPCWWTRGCSGSSALAALKHRRARTYFFCGAGPAKSARHGSWSP